MFSEMWCVPLEHPSASHHRLSVSECRDWVVLKDESIGAGGQNTSLHVYLTIKSCLLPAMLLNLEEGRGTQPDFWNWIANFAVFKQCIYPFFGISIKSWLCSSVGQAKSIFFIVITSIRMPRENDIALSRLRYYQKEKKKASPHTGPLEYMIHYCDV